LTAIFTRKQIEYLAKLQARNIRLIRSDDAGKNSWYQALSKPTAPAERKLRSRIRKRAMIALFELALCGHAGVLPDRAARKEGAASVAGMVETAGTAMMIQALQKARNEGNSKGD